MSEHTPPTHSTENSPPMVEKGTPSDRLKKALDMASGGTGGILDKSDGSYEPTTTAVPERGIFQIVGGYVDDDGVLHNEIELDAMGGDEEDLLGNESVPFMQRMNSIMAACTRRIGTITDPAGIQRAIREMPSGSKTHFFVCLRVVSHYKTQKDVYEMEVRCPDRVRCGKLGHYKISLLDLERYHPDDPHEMVHEVVLPSGTKAKWKTLTGKEDHLLTVLGEASQAEQLSFAILVRMVELDGENVELASTECLTQDGKKVKLNKRATELLRRVKAMKVTDRDVLRAAFMEQEAGIETEVDVTCSHCQLDFIARLDVAQEAFFFPQVTLRRSKRRHST